ncbi:MAG: hypothetical protein AAB834_00325 [Patescibacteria group bacterium]
MDIPTPPPVSDDLTQAADEAAQKLDSANQGVIDAAGALERKVEDGLQQAEQKLDDFIGGIDNFLSKF